MGRRIDPEALRSELLRLLSSGPASGPQIAEALRVSQPTVSRLLKRCKTEVLAMGAARKRRYAKPRAIPRVDSPIPIYMIDDSGAAERAGFLHPIEQDGFYVESTQPTLRSQLYDYEALPYFLRDLRPSGYLGRPLGRQHPDLELPESITDWTPAHCLRYLTRYGWDMPGNLVLGDAPLRAFLGSVGQLARTDRSNYAELAARALGGGGGSSVGGEQPKFLAAAGAPPHPVLVKFSPPPDTKAATRVADLLVVEHLVHEILREHGRNTCQSELIVAEDRRFLEVRRFDRTPQGGRRGVISCRAVDHEFVGSLRSWGETALALADQQRISTETRDAILWREQFGLLIANTDMHHGNLAFFARGEELLGLTPSYDMTAMHYAPVGVDLPPEPYSLPTPAPRHSGVWESALRAARHLWDAVSQDERVSKPFRAEATALRHKLDAWEAMAKRLPPA